MENAYVLAAFPYLAANAWIIQHQGQPSAEFESCQKAALAMLGFSIGKCLFKFESLANFEEGMAKNTLRKVASVASLIAVLFQILIAYVLRVHCFL